MYVYTQGALFSCSHETKLDILQVPLYVSSVSPHLLIQSCFRQNKEVTHAPTNQFGYRCGCCKLTWWWECKCKGQLRQDQELDEESREIVLAFKLSWQIDFEVTINMSKNYPWLKHTRFVWSLVLTLNAQRRIKRLPAVNGRTLESGFDKVFELQQYFLRRQRLIVSCKRFVTLVVMCSSKKVANALQWCQQWPPKLGSNRVSVQ